MDLDEHASNWQRLGRRALREPFGWVFICRAFLYAGVSQHVLEFLRLCRLCRYPGAPGELGIFEIQRRYKFFAESSGLQGWAGSNTVLSICSQPVDQASARLADSIHWNDRCRAALAGMPVRVGRTNWPLTLIGHDCIIHI